MEEKKERQKKKLRWWAWVLVVAAVLVVVAKIGRLENGRLRAWREVPVGEADAGRCVELGALRVRALLGVAAGRVVLADALSSRVLLRRGDRLC